MKSSLVKRIISGTIYALILIFCILFGKCTFLLLMSFFCGVMIHEFLKMTMGSEYRISQRLTIVTGIFFFSLVWAIRAVPAITGEYLFLALIPLCIVMINSLYVKDKTDFGKFANIYTSLIYVAIPITVWNFVVFSPDGEYNGMLLLCMIGLISMSDIGAFVFGMALGQKYGKKLFPSISPKKSWIGFWGGMLICIATSLTFYFTGLWKYAGLEHFTWYHAILFAVVMDVTGVYGDLFESQWKRHYGIKDSGSIIPGHGGLLDRLDSALFAVPAGVIYLTIFKYILTI